MSDMLLNTYHYVLLGRNSSSMWCCMLGNAKRVAMTRSSKGNTAFFFRSKHFVANSVSCYIFLMDSEAKFLLI